MQSFIKEFLETLAYEKAAQINGFTLVPMIGGGDDLEYLLLKEALETGKFEITEVSKGGSVPWLAAENMLDTKVLIIEGEEVVGGKQNRIINVDILIPENTRINIPVSCVEAHRWSERTGKFNYSGRVIDYNVRAKKLTEYAYNREARSSYRPSQSEVWDAVDQTLSYLDVKSETSAAYSAYLKKQDELEAYLSKTKPLKNQVGVAVFYEGELLGIEYLSPAEKFKKLYRSILSSYLFFHFYDMDKKTMKRTKKVNVEKELGNPKEVSMVKSPGEGMNLYVVWDRFSGHGLVYNDKILHFVVLKLEKGFNDRRHRIPDDVVY